MILWHKITQNDYEMNEEFLNDSLIITIKKQKKFHVSNIRHLYFCCGIFSKTNQINFQGWGVHRYNF